MYLKCTCSSTSTARDVLFRTKGDTFVQTASVNNGTSGLVMSTTGGGYVSVFTDAYGVIDVLALSGTVTNAKIDLIAYQILK